MNRLKHLVCTFLFISGSMAYGAAERSGSVQFLTSVRVGSNNLPAGKYGLHWEAGSADVQLKISGQGLKIAVPATVTVSNGRDEVLTHRDGDTQVVEGFTVRSTNFKLK